MISRFCIWWLFKRMAFGQWWLMAKFSHPVLGFASWFGK